MSRFLFFFIVISALIAISCDNAQDPTTANTQEQFIANDTLSIPPLSGLKPVLRLTPEAFKATQNWTFYNNLSQGIDSLSVPTIGALKGRLKVLETVFENKETEEEAEVNTTPDTVETEAIESRMLAIQTQFNVLRNQCALNKPDVNAIAKGIVSIKNGLQHLNLQLNERFSISIKDLLEEIKNEKDDTLGIPPASYPTGPPEIQTNSKN